jgi:hypothetical protein
MPASPAHWQGYNVLMTIQSTGSLSTPQVRESLRPLFWEYDFDCMSWEADAGLIIGRVLSCGTWSTIQWLRRELGDAAIREWITERAGSGLSPRQLRFWQAILGLEEVLVDEWLQEPDRQVWDNRAPR